MAFREIRKREVLGGRSGPRFRLVPCEYDRRLYRLAIGDEPVWTHRVHDCGLHPLCGRPPFSCHDPRRGVTLLFKECEGALFPIPGLIHETALHALKKWGQEQRAKKRGWTYALRLSPCLTCLDEPALIARAEDGLARIKIVEGVETKLCW